MVQSRDVGVVREGQVVHILDLLPLEGYPYRGLQALPWGEGRPRSEGEAPTQVPISPCAV